MHRDHFLNLRAHCAGFTLVEAIIVIVIAGALSVVAASYIQRPIEQYRDQTRRSEMTNTADTAVRRIARDVHLALPNSVRVATNQCVEFIPTYDGGRYRGELDKDGFGKEMRNDVPITQLDVIGPLNAAPVAGDQLVIYNLGIENLDVYAGDNRTSIVGSGSTTTRLDFAAKQFKISSPEFRFQLVSGAEEAVSFVCIGVGTDSNLNGTGTLWRVSKYGFIAAAPSTCQNVATAGVSAILASQVSRCEFSYAPGVVERSAIVSVRLNIKQAGETVSMYHDVNVNNVP